MTPPMEGRSRIFLSIALVTFLPRLLRILYSILNVYSVSSLVISYLFYEFYWKRRNIPHGPVPWLAAGNMPSFMAGGTLDDLFQSWKRKYGGVFTVWIGPTPLVMVCDLASIKKYFVQNADQFSNRWRNHVTDTFMGGVNGVVQIDGEKWREQRRFALHVLRNFGVGRAIMEQKIMHEVSSFCDYIRSHDGPLEMHSPIAVCVGNIINNMLFGVRFPQGSSKMHHLHSLLDQQSQLVVHPLMGLYIAAPISTRIPIINSKWSDLMYLRSQLWAFLGEQVKEHKAKFDSGYRGDDDFTYSYLIEMERRRTTGEDMGHFDEWQMTMLLLDLFFAGMETTVTTLKWAFLLITTHPEVQQKVQAELDHCQGPEITLAHRQNLPYTQATLNEIQRVANILPINLLRTTSERVEMDGFIYPQGTLIVPQISILMQDPSIFADPKSFSPSRFLDKEGKLRRFEEFIPFSIGKRQCLGESLARSELFLIFSNLLKNFHFKPEPGAKMSTDRILGLTVSPPKYKCVLEKRKVDVNQNAID